MFRHGASAHAKKSIFVSIFRNVRNVLLNAKLGSQSSHSRLSTRETSHWTMGRKKQPKGYMYSARQRRGTTYKRAPNMFSKAQKLKENCGVETTILMHNKDDMGTYHLYTTEPHALLFVLGRYMEVLRHSLDECEKNGISEDDKCRNGVQAGECYVLKEAPFNASFRMRAEKDALSANVAKKRKSAASYSNIIQKSTSAHKNSFVGDGALHQNTVDVPLLPTVHASTNAAHYDNSCGQTHDVYCGDDAGHQDLDFDADEFEDMQANIAHSNAEEPNIPSKHAFVATKHAPASGTALCCFNASASPLQDKRAKKRHKPSTQCVLDVQQPVIRKKKARKHLVEKPCVLLASSDARPCHGKGLADNSNSPFSETLKGLSGALKGPSGALCGSPGPSNVKDVGTSRVSRVQTNEEIEREIQQMVCDIQSSFAEVPVCDSAPERKENTQFFSRFVIN